MAPKKGKTNNPNGRPKGSVNKHTGEIKEMILGALADAGGKEYLTTQARENPTAFMGLIGKVIPKDVNASLSGSVVLHMVNEF